MNNETANILIQMKSGKIVQTIQVETGIAATALLFYASLLHLDDEIRYIWKPKFTVATLLYLFAKYPPLGALILAVVGNFVSSSHRLCNDVYFSSTAMEIFTLFGIQGLISVRAYALCQGYRPMTIVLSATFFIPFAVDIFAYAFTIILIGDIATVLSDLLAFLAVIRQVWGLWKEQRNLGLQTKDNLATSLLQQGILRFCFVIFITITASIIQYSLPSGEFGVDVSAFQNVLSTILICESTLDLRRQNTEKPVPNHSALELPTLSFQDNPVQTVQSVLERLHESIMADMGARNDLVNVDGSVQGLEERDQEAA